MKSRLHLASASLAVAAAAIWLVMMSAENGALRGSLRSLGGIFGVGGAIADCVSGRDIAGSRFQRQEYCSQDRIDVVHVPSSVIAFERSLASLCQFLNFQQGVNYFHIIVPDGDEEYYATNREPMSCGSLRPFATNGVNRVVVWPESSVVPLFTSGATYNRTQRQMLLKIAAAWVSTTDFYLAIDEGTIATRPVEMRSLFDTALLRKKGGQYAFMDHTRAKLSYDHAGTDGWRALYESGQLLSSGAVLDTFEFCKRTGPSKFAKFEQTFLAYDPFALRPDPEDQSNLVFEACAAAASEGGATVAKPLSIAPAPLIYSRDIVRYVLAPILEEVGQRIGYLRSAHSCSHGGVAISNVPPSSEAAPWYDVALQYHEERLGECSHCSGRDG